MISMTRFRNAFLILAALGAFLFVSGFGGNSLADKIREGNKLLEDGKAGEAVTAYNDAQLEDPSRPEIFFNMGNAFYRQRKFPEALESYQKSMEQGDAALEAKALYNIGNTLFQQGMLREALEYYKQSLERDPEDDDARFNIEFTERMIKEMLSKAQQTMQQAMQERAEREKAQEAQEGQKQEGREGQEQETGQAAAMGQKDEAREGEEEQEGTAMEMGEGGEKEKERSGEGEKDSKEGQEKEAARRAQSEKERKERGEMTEDEAERYLSVFEKNQEQALISPQGQERRTREYVEKDW